MFSLVVLEHIRLFSNNKPNKMQYLRCHDADKENENDCSHPCHPKESIKNIIIILYRNTV